MKKYTALLLLIVVATSCYRPSVYYGTSKILGYKAVYSTDPEINKVRFVSSKDMSSPGKIYVKDDIILQNDVGFGIHVFDASVPSQLRKVGFINIPGNVELAVKGNYLYANSFTDLVVIDVGDLRNLKEISRIQNAFSRYIGDGGLGSFIPLPEKNAYYECVDPQMGTHVGWQKDTITTCYYYNF